MNSRADLTHQDIPRAHRLAAKNLNSASLPLAVAAVARAAAGFLMRHRFYSLTLRFDCGDFQRGLILSVTALAAVAFAPFLLEDHNFFGATLIDDLARNFPIGDQGRANFGIALTADKKDIRQGHLLADFAVELLDFDDFAFGHAVLLTAGSNYRIFHRIFSETKFLKEIRATVNL
jgi:hypothetical protein